MGAFWKNVNKVCCSILDALQRFSHRVWESSQEGLAVVQAGDDQCLNQELRCVFCEERADPADVVEGKSALLGHSSDVGGAGQSIIGDYAQVPCHLRFRKQIKCQQSNYSSIQEVYFTETGSVVSKA